MSLLESVCLVQCCEFSGVFSLQTGHYLPVTFPQRSAERARRTCSPSASSLANEDGFSVQQQAAAEPRSGADSAQRRRTESSTAWVKGGLLLGFL